ncbi:MAG: preprotein translocase subunit YajC [Terriglobales bacterium]
MDWQSFSLAVWQQPKGAESSWILWLPLVFIFGIFYFLLILPQQKRHKKWQEMLSALKAGDKVVTSGGIRGTVIALKDDHVHLRVPPDNLRLEVARSAVVSVARAEEGGKSQS